MGCVRSNRRCAGCPGAPTEQNGRRSGRRSGGRARECASVRTRGGVCGPEKRGPTHPDIYMPPPASIPLPLFPPPAHTNISRPAGCPCAFPICRIGRSVGAVANGGSASAPACLGHASADSASPGLAQRNSFSLRAQSARCRWCMHTLHRYVVSNYTVYVPHIYIHNLCWTDLASKLRLT